MICNILMLNIPFFSLIHLSFLSCLFIALLDGTLFLLFNILFLSSSQSDVSFTLSLLDFLTSSGFGLWQMEFQSTGIVFSKLRNMFHYPPFRKGISDPFRNSEFGVSLNKNFSMSYALQ